MKTLKRVRAIKKRGNFIKKSKEEEVGTKKTRRRFREESKGELAGERQRQKDRQTNRHRNIQTE